MERVLEPEVMDTWEEAVEYDSMNFLEVNTAFADRAAELGPPHGFILDVGTGTARIPILCCQRKPGWRVVGIDLSGNMLKLGAKNVEKSGLGGNVLLQRVDAKSLPFCDAQFDMVISNSIVHHIPDPTSFFREIMRVLRPSGSLFIRDLFRPPDENYLERIVRRECENQDDHQTKLFRDSLHAAFTVDEVRTIATRAGLTGVATYESSDRHWTMEKAWTAQTGSIARK